MIIETGRFQYVQTHIKKCLDLLPAFFHCLSVFRIEFKYSLIWKSKSHGGIGGGVMNVPMSGCFIVPLRLVDGTATNCFMSIDEN